MTPQARPGADTSGAHDEMTKAILPDSTLPTHCSPPTSRALPPHLRRRASR